MYRFNPTGFIRDNPLSNLNTTNVSVQFTCNANEVSFNGFKYNKCIGSILILLNTQRALVDLNTTNVSVQSVIVRSALAP